MTAGFRADSIRLESGRGLTGTAIPASSEDRLVGHVFTSCRLTISLPVDWNVKHLHPPRPRRRTVAWVDGVFRPYLPLPGWGYVGGEVKDMWYWHGMGPWGWMMMIAFWTVVILLVIWAIRSTARQGQRDEDSALRILDDRFARGEIDREDYEERRRVLESHR
jgi:putative membrane protein